MAPFVSLHRLLLSSKTGLVSARSQGEIGVCCFILTYFEGRSYTMQLYRIALSTLSKGNY